MSDAPSPSPSQHSPARSLSGISVGISVSLGEDSWRFGFSDLEMNRAIIRLSEVLLSAGANLVFGHDWRPGGIMSAVSRLAVAFDASPDERRTLSGGYRITNCVSWDSQPELPRDLRSELKKRRILKVIEVPVSDRPAEVLPQWKNSTKLGVGYSTLRERLLELCDARVCIGGKTIDYRGFVPGILEEAFGSARHPVHNCVLMSGIMGGAAHQILEAGRTREWDKLLTFPFSSEIATDLGPDRVEALRQSYAKDAPINLSSEALISKSGLSAENWKLLANASDIDVVSALTVKALRRRFPSANPPLRSTVAG